MNVHSVRKWVSHLGGKKQKRSQIISVMAWIVFPQEGMLKSSALVAERVTLFGNGAFADVIKMRSLDGP